MMSSGTRLRVRALVLTYAVVMFAAARLYGQPATSAPTTQPQAGCERDRRGAATSQPASWVPRYPGPWDGVLHVARSKDGLKFDAVAGPVIRQAAAPTMARLPDGRLLLVFEYYPRTDRRLFGGLGFALSSDKGATWSDPRPLEVKGLNRSAGSPRSPTLAVKPDGTPELFLVCRNKNNLRTVVCAEIRSNRPTSSAPADAATQSADGQGKEGPSEESLSCELSGRIVLAEKALAVDDLAAAYIGRECHIFGTLAGVGGRRYHGTSADGRRFRRLDDVAVDDVGMAGVVVAFSGGLRSYGTTRRGVISALSTDANKWSREPGVRLSDGEDPTVVTLDDGSWLMVYQKSPASARAKRRPDREEFEAAADAGAVRQDQLAGASSPGEGQEAAPVAEGAAAEPGFAGADQASQASEEDGVAESGEPNDGMNPLAPEDAPLIPPAPMLPGQPDGAEDESAMPGEGEFPGFALTESGVPIPDFVHRVDYRAWLEAQHDPASVADNAWNYYAALMFDPQRGPLGESPLPELINMYTDTGHVGPPAPWNPAEHPDWEQGRNAAMPFVEQFAEAASHQDYVRPLMFASPGAAGGEATGAEAGSGDEAFDRLLINIVLPNLSAHRGMVKQTMADAWRAPDGKPDPQTMLNAFDTCLSSADHLGSSDILIERLVSIAEKTLVERDARLALQQGVFAPEQMEAALEIMIARNHPAADPGLWIKGETAVSLDMTQYLFGADEKGGGGKLNPERLARLNGTVDEENRPPPLTPQEQATLTPERVSRNFTDFYQKFADMARQGYPEVKAKDIAEVTKTYAEDNYVSRAMLPALSRTYQITTRAEASRRATQLTYAVHLYKAQTGQWPQSLNDLPPRFTQGVRTDPFSGQDFAYRPTGDGFTLYSTSENGRDDAGVHHAHWGDGDATGNQSDDYVFWPPQ